MSSCRVWRVSIVPDATSYKPALDTGAKKSVATDAHCRPRGGSLQKVAFLPNTTSCVQPLYNNTANYRKHGPSGIPHQNSESRCWIGRRFLLPVTAQKETLDCPQVSPIQDLRFGIVIRDSGGVKSAGIGCKSL